MNKQVLKIGELRSDEEDASRVKKEISDQLEIEEKRMMEMLQDSGMTSYKSPVGQVVLAYRTSVKTPKLPEEKAALFAWLEEQGLYDAMVSVNSKTLNSLYNAKIEEAKERGDADFVLPGCDGVTITPQLRFKRS